MIVKNTWDGIVEADVMEGPIECITEMKVENALTAIKLGKEPGPTCVLSEMLLAAGHKGKKILVSIYNLIITERKMLSGWKLSTYVPIYKGNNDDPLQCGSY